MVQLRLPAGCERMAVAARTALVDWANMDFMDALCFRIVDLFLLHYFCNSIALPRNYGLVECLFWVEVRSSGFADVPVATATCANQRNRVLTMPASELHSIDSLDFGHAGQRQAEECKFPLLCPDRAERTAIEDLEAFLCLAVQNVVHDPEALERCLRRRTTVGAIAPALRPQCALEWVRGVRIGCKGDALTLRLKAFPVDGHDVGFFIEMHLRLQLLVAHVEDDGTGFLAEIEAVAINRVMVGCEDCPSLCYEVTLARANERFAHAARLV